MRSQRVGHNRVTSHTGYFWFYLFIKLSFFFIILAILRQTGQLFCAMSCIGICLLLFSWLNWNDGKGKTVEVKCCSHSVSPVQTLHCVQLCDPMASLSITNSQSLLKLMSNESVMPSNHLIPSSALLLPSIFPSIRVFSNESVLRIRWTKYWSFQWIFRTDLLKDWLVWSPAVQGTLKSLLQRHSSKESVLQHSASFIVQLSHLYMTTGKTIALTSWTFVGKGMSLLLNMLSRLVIAFLPRSKHLLISWLLSPSAVILEPPKIKSVTVSTVSPS